MSDTQYDTESPQGTEQDDPDIHRAKIGSITIPLNIGFVKSPLGIAIAASMILSLLCAILVSASYNINCYAGYGTTYDYFEFVSVSWFIMSIFRYVIFLLTGSNGIACGSFMPWTLLMMANTALYILFYFIGALAMAVNSCWRGGYKAAAAFGFFTFGTCIAEFIFLLFRLRKEHAPTQNRFLIVMGVQRQSAQNTAPAYDADSNMASEPPKY